MKTGLSEQYEFNWMQWSKILPRDVYVN